jgi:ribulose 1,5-bisphosphate synthetase/thiazole synthase
MFNRTIVAVAIIMTLVTTAANAADTVTSATSSTVIDKTPPTASAPSVVVNNSDVCKSAFSAGVQTQILGIASGITVTDENCERLKLARSLYAMGMKVAAVSALCQDARVFDAMLMAGTPCPYKGKIGTDALAAWNENPNDVPSGSQILESKKKIAEKTNDDYPRINEDR